MEENKTLEERIQERIRKLTGVDLGEVKRIKVSDRRSRVVIITSQFKVTAPLEILRENE